MAIARSLRRWVIVTSSVGRLAPAPQPASCRRAPGVRCFNSRYPFPEDALSKRLGHRIRHGREPPGPGGSGGSGASRARTDDLLGATQALSQLRYSPELVVGGPFYPTRRPAHLH